ncbi:hypothetical protein SAMN04515674_117106 [Pseudarcicella hirudinis]|uniref:Uncharacterized protein n=1 Tax=Pseudarcicella hirudinis TaxID=1079859 RepID=A0A1I5Y918_9BACT|nr:hypothetical protein [Pseudarcicella hirudinis]SFQ40705.1 hypothetical protein SAMN04515674_117106 [Pseudarcicella hirudinis]
MKEGPITDQFFNTFGVAFNVDLKKNTFDLHIFLKEDGQTFQFSTDKISKLNEGIELSVLEDLGLEEKSGKHQYTIQIRESKENFTALLLAIEE